jgi:hypothetical protein
MYVRLSEGVAATALVGTEIRRIRILIAQSSDLQVASCGKKTEFILQLI